MVKATYDTTVIMIDNATLLLVGMPRPPHRF